MGIEFALELSCKSKFFSKNDFSHHVRDLYRFLTSVRLVVLELARISICTSGFAGLISRQELNLILVFLN